MTDLNVFLNDLSPEDRSAIENQIGEGKKYKTPADYMRSKLEGDQFIEKLKAENSELRSLLKTASVVEDRSAAIQTILSKLTSGTSVSSQSGTTPNGNQSHGNGSNQSVKVLTEDDARKLFLEMEQAKKAEANIKFVEGELLKKFGDPNKAAEAVKAKAEDLGVSEETLNALRASSPKAYLRMMGLDSTQQTFGGSVSSRSTINSEAFKNTEGLIRNKAYYDKKKAEMGATKFALNAKLQQQMWQDIKMLGDKFYQD